VNNPAFKDIEENVQSQTNGRFDNPIYDEASSQLPPNSHYSKLKPRLGSMSKSQPLPLAPTSSSVVDILNAIGDYSTLNDSQGTLCTSVSTAKDHMYEEVGTPKKKDERAFSASTVTVNNESYHDYSKINLPKRSRDNAKRVPTIVANPYDSSPGTSPAFHATADVISEDDATPTNKAETLKEIDEKYAEPFSREVPSTSDELVFEGLYSLDDDEENIDESLFDQHDYDSVDGGAHWNISREILCENTDVLYNDAVH